MADVCNTSLDASIKEILKGVDDYLTENAPNYKGYAVKQTKQALEAKIRRIAKNASREDVSAEDVKAAMEKSLFEFRQDFNALVAIEGRARALFEGATNLNKESVRARIVEPLQRVANTAEAENIRFQNMFDSIIESMKTGGKHVTPEQASAAQDLMMDIIHRGDEAIKDYLGSKGEVHTYETLMLKGLKSGHITGTTNLTELDLVFKALKQIENSTQDIVEKRILGYKRLKDHAYVATVDRDKVINMTKEQFVDSFYDDSGNIIVKLANVADDAQARVALSKYYDEIDTARRGEFVRGFSRVGGTLEERNFEFVDEAGELLFWQRLARDNKEGLVRGRIRHLRSQMKDSALRREVGSDPDMWYSHFYNSVNDSVKGADFSSSDVRRTFESLTSSLEHALGRGTYQSETAAQLVGILHDFSSALLTTLSGVRNMLLDGTIFSNVVERSFNPATGAMMGYARHAGTLTKHVLAQGFSKSDFQAAMKLMEQEGISIQMSRAVAARRLYSPEITEFVSGEGWVNKLREYSKYANEAVSKYALADASHKGTRFKGAMSANRLMESWTGELNQQTLDFLARHNWKADEWQLVRDAYKFHTHKAYGNVAIDVNRTINSLSDEVLTKLKIGAENVNDTRYRLINKLQNTQIDLVDELATRPTFKTGIGLMPTAKSDLQNGFWSLVLKFQGMSLSAQQSITRALRRANGVDQWDPGFLGTGIRNPVDLVKTGLRKDNIAVNMEMLTALAAGGYMIEVARDLRNGKTPAPISSQNILDSVANTGSFGLPMAIAQNIAYGQDIVNSPLSKPIRAASKLKRATEDAMEGDFDNLKVSAYELLKLSFPPSYIILQDNSLWDAYVKEWLNLPTRGARQQLRRDEQEFLLDF